MKIVLFDDNPSDQKNLSQIIAEWCRMRGYTDIIVNEFNSFSVLNFSFDDILPSDIFFLDIITPESQSTGFLLAERISQKNPKAIIIFTTNSREYMESAFEISAFRYMLKPLDNEKVMAVLDKIYKSPSLRHQKKIVLPGTFQTVIVDLDQIIYIQAHTSDHYAVMHLTDSSTVNVSLTDFSFTVLAEKHLSKDFVQCHRSTIINMNYVTGFDKQHIFLYGGYEIKIGKTYRKDLINILFNHSKGPVLR